MCDEIHPDPSLRFAEGLVLYAPAPSFDEAARALAPALARLLKPTGGRTLTFLHASRSGRWPTRRRGPPILAESGRAFRELGAGKGFDGGIRVDARAAAAVIEPLAWSVRMDMGYGPVYLAPEHAPFVASLCQYGNLHVEGYDAGFVDWLRHAAGSAGLAEWTDGICDERWELGGAIPGRGLRLGTRSSAR
jgi:hypothetical protein